MPKVSVVIPTYNNARYLPESIGSILDQSCQNFEIVIVDDGSTDNTKEVVLPYTIDKPVRYIYQKNQGLSSARNTGMREAKGEYISFLDADDTLLPNSLSKKIEFLDKYTDIEMVLADYYLDIGSSRMEKTRLKEVGFADFFQEAMQKLTDSHFVFNSKLYIKYLEFPFCPFHPSMIMLRKNIISELGEFRPMPGFEDVEFILRVVKKYRIGFIDEGLSVYHKSRGNFMNRPDIYLNGILEHIKFLRKDLNTFGHHSFTKPRKSILVKAIKKRISRDYYKIGRFYLSNMRILNSREAFSTALKFNPFSLDSYIFMFVSLLPVSTQKRLRKIKRAMA